MAVYCAFSPAAYRWQRMRKRPDRECGVALEELITRSGYEFSVTSSLMNLKGIVLFLAVGAMIYKSSENR